MRADMRQTLCLMVALCAVLGSSEAHAQFANRSLGLGFGFTRFEADSISFGLPITLEGTLYIEDGFDLFLRIPLMILNQSPLTPALILATGGQFGARYLFMEETLRPWAGAEVSFLYIFRSGDQGAAFFGPGIAGGVDYFVTDTVSLGARANFDLFIALNVPVRPTYGIGINVHTYF